MFENMTSEEIKDYRDEVIYAQELLESSKSTLERLDNKNFKDEINKIQELIDEIDLVIEDADTSYDEKMQEEEKEYNAEMREMNRIFERSRL